ncbi:phage tail protein [Caldifermentibacillus hisashii]|uniref:phage tail protein n=1 Tax=Caldifermentibacillus hisashii TaxID=996558 RepID=UPI0031B673D0
MADGKVVIDVILDDGTVAKGVANLDKQLGGLSGSGKRAAAGIKEIVTSLGLVTLAAKAIDMVKNSLDGAISRYDTLNNFPRVLQLMGFDAKQSKKAIDELSDGIDGLPTTLDSVAKTTQRLALMTGDLEGATKTTLALNNAFLASGASAADAERGLEQYVQMLSTGTVDLESWRTLQETMPIALNKTAEAFGFAGKSAQNDLYNALKSGEITFEDFNNKLIELNDGVGGFAELARKSTGGIKTSWNNMKTAITKGVADVIGAIDKALGSFGGIAGIFDALKSHIKDTFSFITNLIPQIASVISTLYNAFMSVWNDTGEVDDLLGKLGISPEVAAIVESILKTITDSIKTAFDFIGTIISGLKQFWANNGQEILQNAIIIFQGVWDTVQTAFDGIKGVIENVLGNNVIPFIQEKLSTIKQFWDENGQQIMQAVQNAFEFIKGVIEFVMPVVQFIIETVWAAIKDIIGGALDIIMGLIQVFTGIFTGDWSQLWEGIKKILGGAVDLILGIMSLNFLGGIKKAFTSMFETSVNTVKNMWAKIVEFFKTFTDDAASKVSGMASKVWEFAKNMATNFINTISNLKNNVVNKFSEIKNGIIDKVKSIDLKDIGKNIIQGLINGIGSMASAVVDKVKSIGKSISNGFKNALGIHSPSKVMADIAKWIPAGIGVGIEKNEKSAIKSLQGLTDNLVSNIQPEIAVTNRLRGAKAPLGSMLTSGIQLTQSIIQGQTGINQYDDGEVKALLRKLVEKEINVYMDKEKVGSIMDGEQARRINLFGRRVALD